MARLSKKKFEELFAALARLSREPAAEDRNNVLHEAFDTGNPHLVERAARLVTEALIPGFEAKIIALLDAFFDKEDPACVTKTALAEALDYLDCEDEAPFLRGLRHVQRTGPPPAEDTAINLRARCLLAIARLDLDGAMNHLADGLTDPEHQVRSAAAQGIGASGRQLGVPLLRFKLRSGDREPEVTGEVLKAYLLLDTAAALPFAKAALQSEKDEEREYAALALGETRPEGAMELLTAYANTAPTERDLRVALIALLMMRGDGPTEFVRELAHGDDPDNKALARELLDQFGYLLVRPSE